MLGKRIVALLTIATLWVGFICAPLTEAFGPGIRIEGELRQFNLPVLLIEGRTMVPLRFIIEDPVFKGSVYWDQSLQKVALDCQGKYIEFIVGSKTAKVDGAGKEMDIAPLIYQDRTYVPLRFLAESLGAVVNWNGVRGEVDICFTYKPEVWAYYYCTPWDEYASNIDLFTDVILRWFTTDAKGQLLYEYQDQYLKALKYAQNNGALAHLGVALMDKGALHGLLNSPECRKNLIDQLNLEVKKGSYDGVNIDFEFIPPEDANLFTQFLRELKHSLGTDKTVSVAVFARTGQEKWPVAYQYEQIGQIVDRVVVMAYDYSYSESSPGPVAPLWWVQEVVDYMVANIPREKILLGLPTYGYDWGSSGKALAVTRPKLASIQAKYQVSSGFDWESMSPYYLYTDENGGEHTIWLENQSSLAAKQEQVNLHHLGGIAFWRIGNGFDDLYKNLRK